MKANLIVFLGAAIGGLLGFFVFHWLIGQGMYGVMVPGCLIGFGGSFSSHRSRLIPIFLCFAALLLGLFAEWYEFPFTDDKSLLYFIPHFYHLKPVTLLMIAIGGFTAYWLPASRYAKQSILITCTKCSAVLKPDDRFCASCGQPVKTDINSPTS